MLDNIHHHRWQCKDLDLALLLEAVGSGYRIEDGRSKHEKLEIYDSFERKFFLAGLALVRSAGRFRVVSAEDLHSVLVSSDSVFRHHRPLFYWDFEPGEFQRVLRKKLKLRAVVSLAKLELDEQELCVRNGDGKIVVRLWRQTISTKGEVASLCLTAIPLLGYEDEAEELVRKISELPGYEEPSLSPVERVLDLAGKLELPLVAKAVIPIKPEQSAQEAVTEIAAFMLRVARQNEPGLIGDVDTEFLHAYRVAIRKLRSVISLVKGIFPPEERRRLKDEFGDHARATNRLRDLDVYLLEEERYRELLPECLRSGLDRMFGDFRAQRGRVVGSLRRRLKSADYREGMEREFEWLGRSDLPKGARADVPIAEVVEAEVRKHFRHVRKLGMALTDETPDEEVHELRIECKKLRYLLELFTALFPEDKLKVTLGRLRGLQSVLGDFNDYSVQLESMATYLKDTPNLDRSTSAAVGGLIAVLYRRKLDARAQVAERFKGFSDGKMRERFKVLFAGIKVSGS